MKKLRVAAMTAIFASLMQCSLVHAVDCKNISEEAEKMVLQLFQE